MKKKSNPITALLIRLLGTEKKQGIRISLFAIFLSLLVGMLIVAATGKNPIQAYVALLQGSGILPKAAYANYKSQLTDFMSFMNYLTPMIFAALAVSVALKAGLFNIGVSGQMLAAGFASTILVGYSALSGVVAKTAVLLIGVAVGAAVGGCIGFLKCRYNINEVVASIMINYILQYVISFWINTCYIDPISRQSRTVSAAARLTLMETPLLGLKIDLPLGSILALLVVFLIYFLLEKTTLGYELKAIGHSVSAAKYAGIPVGKNIVLAMMISGALSGLAGVTYYLGYVGSIQPRVLASIGFDAIAISLLGNNNPIGIVFSALLIAVMGKGNSYMSAKAGVQIEVASVITGVILLFSACGAYIQFKVQRAKENQK